MSTQTAIDTKAAQSQELLQIILNLSTEEIDNLLRLLYQAARLKRNGRADSKAAPAGVFQHQRRFIDPEDGGPVWELDLVDEFDRASCYENTMDEV
jgi:hypothetical protein